MRYLLPACVLFAIAVLSSAEQAQERSEEECSRLQPAIRSPVEIVACTADLAGSQRQLNLALSRLRSGEAPKQRPPIERAHRLWLAFRDAEYARKAAGEAGSTMNSSDDIACKAVLNRDRAAEI
jgi:uncharacterized protein YecT (DUF1311 family)